MKNSFSFWATVMCSMLLLSACKYSGDYQTVNANNKFSIALPSWMKETKDLKPGADLQYANRFRNFYAIGETISNTDLQKEMQANIATLRKSMPDAVVSDSLDITAGDLKGVRAEVFGKMSKENIYFSEVLFTGKKGIYHLSIWTRSESRKLHFKEDINKIIATFKEI